MRVLLFSFRKNPLNTGVHCLFGIFMFCNIVFLNVIRSSCRCGGAVIAIKSHCAVS